MSKEGMSDNFQDWCHKRYILHCRQDDEPAHRDQRDALASFNAQEEVKVVAGQLTKHEHLTVPGLKVANSLHTHQHGCV